MMLSAGHTFDRLAVNTGFASVTFFANMVGKMVDCLVSEDILKGCCMCAQATRHRRM